MFGIDRKTLVLALATLLALPLVGADPARAGSERYIAITSLPYTISSPGCYRLVGNLSCTIVGSSGPAIAINCDNVVLDLDGFSIVYVGSAGYTYPVNAVTASNRSNVTVRNGSLRGFYRGVVLTGATTMYNTINTPGIVVEDLTVVESRQSAIVLEGFYGAIVRRCNVAATENTSAGGSADTFGIRVTGRNAVIHDNVVTSTNVNPNVGTAYAIHVTDCDHAVVERNTISNDDFPFYPNTVGIKAGGDFAVIAGNRVAYVATGITYGTYGTGPYRDNIVVACGTSYTGGTDAGNNY